MEDRVKKIISSNYDPDWEELGLDKAAKEIADTFKRFMEWGVWYSDVGKLDYQIVYFLEENKYTLDELFEYWSEVIDQKEN